MRFHCVLLLHSCIFGVFCARATGASRVVFGAVYNVRVLTLGLAGLERAVSRLTSCFHTLLTALVCYYSEKMNSYRVLASTQRAGYVKWGSHFLLTLAVDK